MILRPVLRGDYLLVGPGPEGSLKPGRVYRILRRLAKLCGVNIGVRELRLARYAAEVYGFVPAFMAAAA